MNWDFYKPPALAVGFMTSIRPNDKLPCWEGKRAKGFLPSICSWGD